MRLGNQKLKLYYLEKILREQTDDKHSLSIADLTERLSEYGIPVERKTLYSDIEALKLLGLDIEVTRGRGNRYALLNREFELPELRLLVDAVQSSKFISERKSRVLIKKLQKLTSVHEARRLNQQVFVCKRVKSANEGIYYAIDALNGAIADGKKVQFKYYEYTPEKQMRLRNNGEFYQVSPIAMLWDDEYYYLVCHYAAREGTTHFRVDKMTEVSVLEENVKQEIRGFDPASYAKKMFGMFNGKEYRATLRFDNSLIGVVVDRFGTDIVVKNQGDHFLTSVSVMESPIFYGWMFQLGDKAEIMAPPALREGMKDYLAAAASRYQ